jgi:hypothetical protein
MDKATFEKWAQECNWLPFDEPANPNGHQVNFATPNGNLLAVVFNLEGKVITAIQLPPFMPMPPQMQGPGFPGFGRPPILGHG